MNDGEKKKFELPEIIILLILAITNDALTVIAVLGLLLPVIGQIFGGLIELLNTGISAIIIMWFIMKVGFFSGAGPLTQVGGSIGEYFGIPCRTISLILGIMLVNYGDTLGKVANIVAPGVGGAVAGTALAAAGGKGIGGALKATKEARASIPTNSKIISTPQGARVRNENGSGSLRDMPINYRNKNSESDTNEESFGMPKGTFETIEEENFKIAA